MDSSKFMERQPILRPDQIFVDRRRCRVPSFKALSAAIIGLLLLVVPTLFLMQYRSYHQENSSSQSLDSEMRLLTSTLNGQSKHVLNAWQEGEKRVKQLRKLEKQLYNKGVHPMNDTPSANMQHLLKSRLPLEGITNCALIVEHVKRHRGKCFEQDHLPSYCKSSRPNVCDNEQNNYYRSLNGSCNNLRNPGWGMAQSGFLRLLEPDYADGVSVPRLAVHGGLLPNARLISSTFYTQETLPEPNFTLMAMAFGLFVDHDMIQIGTQIGYDGTPITCCDKRIDKDPSLRHPECLEIDIPTSDPFYGPRKINCLDFVRSKPIPGRCAGQREQVNMASSYIDGSAIYGSSADRSGRLRAFRNGQLLSRSVNGTYLLPVDMKLTCGSSKCPVSCMAAGDFRVNENIDLATMHNIWFREHNRVAEKLATSHPEWNDEKTFQEARRIVAAEIQHITYNEFLPLVLGRRTMEKYGLTINEDSVYDMYDDKEEAGIYNVFAAAAFRFGHSLVQGMLKLYDEKYHLKDVVPLHETFSNPELLYLGRYDPLIRGMLRQRTHSVSNFITTEVRDRLFQSPTSDSGLDLSAFGIQRGRDHGIRGYTAWRKVCGLSPVETWEDMHGLMRNESVELLKILYMSVQDVDLTPAALAEYHVEGSMLGPTYNCLIAKQFRKQRVADRFWFEVRNQKWSFEEAQLKELYKSSMARIVCDNSDNIKLVQMLAFQVPSITNPVLDCDSIPTVDLSKW